MALSPTMAGPTSMPPAGGASPDDMAPANDTADMGGENECIATICRTPDGKFVLYAGDEPEGDAEPGAEPQTFDNGPALLRAVMGLIESDAGAEKAFGDVRRGKMGAPPPAAGGM